VLRFVQGLFLLLALAGLAVAIILTELSVPDIFATILAFIPTGWGILSVCSLLSDAMFITYFIFLVLDYMLETSVV